MGEVCSPVGGTPRATRRIARVYQAERLICELRITIRPT